LPVMRTPMRGIFLACCASTASGAASKAPPNIARNVRRSIVRSASPRA
jgi:hypothetical protein